MDYWEIKSIVVEALSEVRWGTFCVSPGHLKVRKISKRGGFTWRIGFWFKSYGPDIEVNRTNIRSRKWVREFIIKRIEENLPDWIKVVEARSRYCA